MQYRLKVRLIAIGLCGAFLLVLSSACDLSYECEPVEPGGAGAGIPTGSAGAGDHFRDGEQGGEEDINAASEALMAGCTSKDCYDMFEDCEDIGGRCIVGFPGCDVHGSSPCKSCFAACLDDRPYPSQCNCRQCGFR